MSHILAKLSDQVLRSEILPENTCQVAQAAAVVCSFIQRDASFKHLVSTKLCAQGIQGASSCQENADAEHSMGSAAFRNGAYDQALVHYTTSLRHLDHMESKATQEKAAQLLLNRCLCLLRLAKPDAPHALDDCEQALLYCPADAKALYRRACAHQALGQSGKALQDAVAAQMVYTDKGRPVPKEISTLAAKLQGPAGSAATQPNGPSRDLHLLPATDAGTSSLRQSAAALATPTEPQLRLQSSQHEGRHLTAAVDISKGSLLFSEDPVAAVLLKAQRKQML
ncbi:hypothetical protein WJX84_002356 [Apatococcus fuscideae]|uniref:Uncharacterized protein n=1 Tax=Apatococcus fuscideae TaxID=2026836 RepID=A0AAW1SMX0_9CHLO